MGEIIDFGDSEDTGGGRAEKHPSFDWSFQMTNNFKAQWIAAECAPECLQLFTLLDNDRLSLVTSLPNLYVLIDFRREKKKY